MLIKMETFLFARLRDIGCLTYAALFIKMPILFALARRNIVFVYASIRVTRCYKQ